MKILYTTTLGVTMGFFTSFLTQLVGDGNVIDVATNEPETMEDDARNVINGHIYSMPWVRFPFSKNNIKAVREIHKLVSNGQYDIVHCHTPIAAICTRIACKSLRKKGVKVIYTAHGFHFFKGAPLKNWLLFYPIEKYCARFTDVLITINVEDYQLAKKRMKAKRVVYVPGVGIDLQKFSGQSLTEDEKQVKRSMLGIQGTEKMFLSVGELSRRKNHEIVIRALSQVRDRNWKYYIAGSGMLQMYLEELIRDLGLQENIFLLGQREDISELCECADLFIFPSLQEGLPVALMEAIASRTPIICSNIRGNVDLIGSDDLFDPHNENSVKEKIEYALSTDFCSSIERNFEKLKKFSIDNINMQMDRIYGGK